MTTAPTHLLAQLTDHHVHTRYCNHAEGEMEQYVQAAVDRGLGGIGFSAHLPTRTPIEEKVNVTREEMDLIVRGVEELRAAWRGRIRIFLAGEADYFPDREDAIAAQLGSYPLDYVIGSVHYVGDWPVDHGRYRHWFDRLGATDAYHRYFAMVLRPARSGLFDIIGHLDVVKKFGHRPADDWSDLAEEVAGAIGAAGLCLDVNTAGRDKPIGEIYPSPDLLRRCARHGAGATLGSDAHAPGEVGRYFEDALALIRRCGFDRVTQFQQRRREQVRLA